MVRKSRGPRHKARHKMITKRRSTPSDFLKEFSIGDRVFVKLQPNVYNKGYPYIKYHGIAGQVMKKLGRAYVIKFYDGNAEKKLILNPVHLKKQEV